MRPFLSSGAVQVVEGRAVKMGWWCQRKMCVLPGTLERTAEAGDGGPLLEALRLLLRVVDVGSHRCFLNTGVKNAKGCFNHSPKNGPQEEKLKSQDLCKRWWGSGPGIAVIVDKILEEETQKSLEMDWFSMCLCVHTYTGMKDDAKIWGLCDHLDEVILWEKVLFGF